jgi:hypothetical protein
VRVDSYILSTSGVMRFLLFKVLGFRVRVRSECPTTSRTKTARVAQRQKTSIPDFIESVNLVV